jgi:hypothetical protein
VWDAIERFWLRDFRADVAVLNRRLAKAGRESAGFETAPPSVLTGDPTALEPGNCLMVLGINPAWRNSPEFLTSDIGPAREAYSSSDFEKYRERRANYFRGGPEFHGGHFTRLGTALRGAFTVGELSEGDKRQAAKALFDRYILMADLLPWWSTNIERMDLARLSDVPFYSYWQEILRGWMRSYSPQAIVVNTSGKAQRNAVELLLETDLAPFSQKPKAYYGTVEGTPLFVHPQLNGCRELSHERYQRLAQEWQAVTSAKIGLR